MKNFSKVLGIIAFTALIGLSMTACDTDGPSTEGGSGIKVPGAGQLPNFPTGSNPASTKINAYAVLAEMRQSEVLDSFTNETWDVFSEQPEIMTDNYSFSDRSLPSGSVKVSASEVYEKTNTGGFITMEDKRKAILDIYETINELYNETPLDLVEISRLEGEIDNLDKEIEKINFALNDKGNYSYSSKIKGEATKAISKGGVTIAQGSINESQSSSIGNSTVSTSGTYLTFRASGSSGSKNQNLLAVTVTGSTGSIKIIYNYAYEYNSSEANVLYCDGSGGTRTETTIHSGSLKVYGDKNALLIDHQITDWDSLMIANTMLLYDPYIFDPTGAIPLSSDVKVNGNVTLGSPVYYSINAVKGTKYHLWWDDFDTDTTSSLLDVKVRGYTSEGDMFFDTDGDWDLPWSNYYSFTAASTGTVYIMVYPIIEGDSGAFTIAYNTSGTKPALSVLDKEASGASFLKQDTAAKPKKPLGFLKNINKGFLNK